MTGDKSNVKSLKAKEGGFLTYGDNNKGRILGIGNINNFLTISIENVLYVIRLKHNLLSISQLCDKGFKIIFNQECFTINESISNNIKFVGSRIGNTYMLNVKSASHSNMACLISNDDLSWLWHMRITHPHESSK